MQARLRGRVVGVLGSLAVGTATAGPATVSAATTSVTVARGPMHRSVPGLPQRAHLL